MPPATGGGDGLPAEDPALVVNEKPVHATKTNGLRDDEKIADQKHVPENMRTVAQHAPETRPAVTLTSPTSAAPRSTTPLATLARPSAPSSAPPPSAEHVVAVAAPASVKAIEVTDLLDNDKAASEVKVTFAEACAYTNAKPFVHSGVAGSVPAVEAGGMCYYGAGPTAAEVAPLKSIKPAAAAAVALEYSAAPFGLRLCKCGMPLAVITPSEMARHAFCVEVAEGKESKVPVRAEKAPAPKLTRRAAAWPSPRSVPSEQGQARAAQLVVVMPQKRTPPWRQRRAPCGLSKVNKQLCDLPELGNAYSMLPVQMPEAVPTHEQDHNNAAIAERELVVQSSAPARPRHGGRPLRDKDHAVIAQHKTFGKVTVPKGYLNTDKEAKVRAAKVAERAAEKVAAGLAAQAEQLKTKREAQKLKAAAATAAAATQAAAEQAVVKQAATERAVSAGRVVSFRTVFLVIGLAAAACCAPSMFGLKGRAASVTSSVQQASTLAHDSHTRSNIDVGQCNVDGSSMLWTVGREFSCPRSGFCADADDDAHDDTDAAVDDAHDNAVDDDAAPLRVRATGVMTGSVLVGDNLAVGADLVALDSAVNPLPVKPSSLLTSRQQARGAVPPQWLPMLLGGDPHVFADKAALQTAVNLWAGTCARDSSWVLVCTAPNPTEAETEYGHISTWDVSAVDDMSNLFKDSANFNDDIRSWDTGEVTNMYGMFQGAAAFNQPLNWNVGRVTDMNRMFQGAAAFNQPLAFNTGMVEDMTHMFNGAVAFNQPLDWDVSKVKSMSLLVAVALIGAPTSPAKVPESRLAERLMAVSTESTSTKYYASGWGVDRTADSSSKSKIPLTFYTFRPSSDRYRVFNTSLSASPPQGFFGRLFGSPNPGLNRVQVGFIEWTASRFGLSLAEAASRYARSNAAVEGGWSGKAFRNHDTVSQELMSCLANDDRRHVYDAYRLNAPLHTLRLLSYSVQHHRLPGVAAMAAKALLTHESHESHASLKAGIGGSKLVVVEYGAGMAQTTLLLAEELRALHGLSVELHLYDISTPRWELLSFLCERDSLPCFFHDASNEPPMPLPAHVDVLVAQEVLEHMHPDQVEWFKREMLRSLSKGAIVATNLANHESEFFHVNPQLQSLQGWFTQNGFTEVRGNTLYVRERVHIAPRS